MAALVQQTVMTDLRLDDVVLNFDQWDGYAPARQRLLDQAAATDTDVTDPASPVTTWQTFAVDAATRDVVIGDAPAVSD